jgi:hypothetical protein
MRTNVASDPARRCRVVPSIVPARVTQHGRVYPVVHSVARPDVHSWCMAAGCSLLYIYVVYCTPKLEVRSAAVQPHGPLRLACAERCRTNDGGNCPQREQEDRYTVPPRASQLEPVHSPSMNMSYSALRAPVVPAAAAHM